MIAYDAHLNQINSPVRQIKAGVLMYTDGTLASQYTYKDYLKSFTIERVGEGKFFGYGICQKANFKILDVNREKDVSTANTFKIYMQCDESPAQWQVIIFPVFKVTEVNRNEKTNELSITAYDAIHQATKHTVSELELPKDYTIKAFAEVVATAIGAAGVQFINCSDSAHLLNIPGGANFEGTETLRDALNSVAECTQTIYYMNYENKLVFKRLDRDGLPVLTIDKSKYTALESKTNRRLCVITHTTDLGDTTTTSQLASSGSTQFIRNNPFWELRDDIGTLLDKAIAAIGGITINQFECSWRGNYLVEIGDKVQLISKDDKAKDTFLLNDTLTYNGAFSQKTEWKYQDNEEETSTNPTTIGDALKETYAKVDKVNKEIELVASKYDELEEKISKIEIEPDSITSVVTKVEKLEEIVDANSGKINTLTNKVSQMITAEDVQIQIEETLEEGVDKIITKTGFTFNEEGLSIEKSDSIMKTVITEDGMTIYRNNHAALEVNNEGVKAEDLHATTYLLIGNNSRFEDYIETRTGCFWIGKV